MAMHSFNIHESFISFTKNINISTQLAAILSLTELIKYSDAGTMFELVNDLNRGVQLLRELSSNPISINAGCELFIAFVTLSPHDSNVCIYYLLIPITTTNYSYIAHFFSTQISTSHTRPNLRSRSFHLS